MSGPGEFAVPESGFDERAGAAGKRRPGDATAPGARAHLAADGVAIACPFCGSDHTELFSLFGSSLLTSQYYCRACRSTFERVKWGDHRQG
jgi:hypothetical protein